MASEVFIEATETDPSVRARGAVGELQRQLLDGLAAAVRATAEQPGAETRAALGVYCSGEVRRFLAATDRTLHAAASGAAETRLLVRALRAAAAAIEERIDALPAAEGLAFDGSAAALAELLTVHLAVQRTVLLPALAELPGADLPTLVADLRTLLAGGEPEEPDEIDVRTVPHGRRHPRIFTRFARLAPGESFTLVNNHDPKPLRREFQAAHPSGFTWEYLESGPELWRIRIGRVAADA